MLGRDGAAGGRRVMARRVLDALTAAIGFIGMAALAVLALCL